MIRVGEVGWVLVLEESETRAAVLGAAFVHLRHLRTLRAPPPLHLRGSVFTHSTHPVVI